MLIGVGQQAGGKRFGGGGGGAGMAEEGGQVVHRRLCRASLSGAWLPRAWLLRAWLGADQLRDLADQGTDDPGLGWYERGGGPATAHRAEAVQGLTRLLPVPSAPFPPAPPL